MEMCEEMRKLRLGLEARNIEYEDNSSVASEQQKSRLESLGLDTNVDIYRTSFYVGKYSFSVISEYGTYGGYSPITKEDQGLLECMSDKLASTDPIGFLTADEIFAIIDGTPQRAVKVCDICGAAIADDAVAVSAENNQSESLWTYQVCNDCADTIHAFIQVRKSMATHIAEDGESHE